MKIALGADHAGFPAKEALLAEVSRLGHEAVDLGTRSAASVDYPVYARAVAEAVSSGEADRGVLACGTGVGMSMAANKVPGVRAALCHDGYTTEMSRRHNDANVLCLGARVLAVEAMVRLLGQWLSTPFEGGKHERRVKLIG